MTKTATQSPTQSLTQSIHETILTTIGNTPIVKLNRVTSDVSANVYAKLEFMNPGGSVKDRIGYWLIQDAEKQGRLRPGGTIVEGTSGNTGMGLAIASAIYGYKCIFVLPDKMSEEKIRALRAFGARVIVTPTAVAPEDPRSYYSVSRRLGTETPNAIYVDQYNNLANRDCHYHTTGPEIWEQFPQIDVFVAGIGTGGTICGVGRYLREKNPSIEVVAVDPVGSIVYDKFKFNRDVPAKPYKIEGIGEDFFPKNYDFDVISDMSQVEDKESFVMTRDLVTKEGLYCGISSGAAVAGAKKWIKAQGSRLKDKNVLVLLPDSGNRYLSKVFDDDWMREAGFLESPSLGTVADLLAVCRLNEKVLMVAQKDRLDTVIDLMRTKGISQLPVEDGAGWIKGIVTESGILKALYEGRAKASDTVAAVVDTSVEFVNPSDPIERVSALVTAGRNPLAVDPRDNRVMAVITKIDLLTYLGSRR